MIFWETQVNALHFETSILDIYFNIIRVVYYTLCICLAIYLFISSVVYYTLYICLAIYLLLVWH